MQDKEFYNKGLRISAQLIQQFDKNQIRKALLTLYSNVIAEDTVHKMDLRVLN